MPRKARTQKTTPNPKEFPYYKTPEQMSVLMGIGANTLRKAMDDGELYYIIIGNRRKLTEDYVIEWCERIKRTGRREDNENGNQTA
jgi:excisionase family DNA binding protein